MLKKCWVKLPLQAKLKIIPAVKNFASFVQGGVNLKKYQPQISEDNNLILIIFIKAKCKAKWNPSNVQSVATPQLW